MEGFGCWTSFQLENEDEALAKALENSRQEYSQTITSARQPSRGNREFQMLSVENEDEEVARATALFLEEDTYQTKNTGRPKYAIPLCLPNNYSWNAQTGAYMKTEDQRSSLYVVEPALEKLRKVEGPVSVVAIAGPYRNGKSYILSETFDQPEVFPLGHQMEAETMGIWLWIVPGKFKDSNGQEFTVVLLDSEGIDAASSKGSDDHQIFTLTVLLASVLIYNSQGVPTRSDVEKLDYIVNLSKRIQVQSTVSDTFSPSQNSEFFHKTFPHFIWLLRDVTQTLPKDCKNIKEYFLKKVFKEQVSSDADYQSEQRVAESILRFFPGFDAFMLPPPTVDLETMKSLNQSKSKVNSSFLKDLEKFKELMRETLSPKHSFNDGEFVTGEGLAALVGLYVDAINAPDAIPNVRSAWDAFVEAKCADEKQSALLMYDAFLEDQLSDVPLPCGNKAIRMCHNVALEHCEDQLMTKLAGISTNSVEMAARELKISMEAKLTACLTKNEELTRQFCKVLLDGLKKTHLDPVFERLLGKEAVKVSFEDIIGGYQRIKDDYFESAVGAEHVIAAAFVEIHEELLKEKEQYLGLLTQLKDFDEERSRELAARAYQEQERKRLEEQQARLQQENRERKKQMEMLIRNLEEEKKRFSDQMNGEQKAHQEQIQNMMDASMKQAQEERQAFVNEHEALREQLLALQEYNEENMKIVKDLSDLAAKQEKEKVALLEQMKNQAYQDREDQIKKINDKHDEEMKALRDEMNAKLDEVTREAALDGATTCETASLLTKRTREAEVLQGEIEDTHKRQQEVEKPSFLKKVLEFVGGVVVPAVGTVVSVVIPGAAAIAAPVATVVGAGIKYVTDNICSVM